MKTFSLLLASFLFCATFSAAQQDNLPANNPPEWVTTFKKLSSEQRKKYFQLFAQAQQQFSNKNAMECLFTLLEAEKIFADNPDLHNLRGACYIEIRNIVKAKESFKKAHALAPNNLSVRFNLAETYFVNHEFQQALKAFTELEADLAGKKNAGMHDILQFKRYICAVKLNDEQLCKSLESLHGPMSDTPYYYCVQAIKAFQANNPEEAQGNLLSANRIYAGTQILQGMIDSMMESGFLISPLGRTNTDDKAQEEEAEPAIKIPRSL